jgi:6-phosphogluconolactonase
LVLLGLGDDVHTASLFPESPALDRHDAWFVENRVEKFNAYRYTLTPPAINSGREIWFLVTGQGKREAVRKLLQGPENPKLYPAQLIRPTRIFLTDDAAP